MKKTITKGLLALALMAALIALGCAGPTTEIEIPGAKNPPQGPDYNTVVNEIDEVQLTITPTLYGFELTWPPVIEATTYDVWRTAPNAPIEYLDSIPAERNKLVRFLDVVKYDGDGNATLEAGKSYTYTIFLQARRDTVRDGTKTEGTKAADADLFAPGTELPQLIPSVIIDGKPRNLQATVTVPDLADYLPILEKEGVSLNYKSSIKKTAGIGYTTLAAFNFADAGATKTFTIDPVKDLITAEGYQFNTKWPQAYGSYEITAKYDVTLNNSYFKVPGAKTEPYTYEGLFDYGMEEYEQTGTPTISAFALRLNSRVGWLPNQVNPVARANNQWTSTPGALSATGYMVALQLNVRGRAGVEYTLERKEVSDGPGFAEINSWTQVAAGQMWQYNLPVVTTPTSLWVSTTSPKVWPNDGSGTGEPLTSSSPDAFYKNDMPYVLFSGTGAIAQNSDNKYGNFVALAGAPKLAVDAMGLFKNNVIFTSIDSPKKANYIYRIVGTNSNGEFDSFEMEPKLDATDIVAVDVDAEIDAAGLTLVTLSFAAISGVDGVLGASPTYNTDGTINTNANQGVGISTTWGGIRVSAKANIAGLLVPGDYLKVYVSPRVVGTTSAGTFKYNLLFEENSNITMSTSQGAFANYNVVRPGTTQNVSVNPRQGRSFAYITYDDLTKGKEVLVGGTGDLPVKTGGPYFGKYAISGADDSTTTNNALFQNNAAYIINARTYDTFVWEAGIAATAQAELYVHITGVIGGQNVTMISATRSAFNLVNIPATGGGVAATVEPINGVFYPRLTSALGY